MWNRIRKSGDALLRAEEYPQLEFVPKGYEEDHALKIFLLNN